MVITNNHASTSDGVKRYANCWFSGGLGNPPNISDTIRLYEGQDSYPGAYAKQGGKVVIFHKRESKWQAN